MLSLEDWLWILWIIISTLIIFLILFQTYLIMSYMNGKSIEKHTLMDKAHILFFISTSHGVAAFTFATSIFKSSVMLDSRNRKILGDFLALWLHTSLDVTFLSLLINGLVQYCLVLIPNKMGKWFQDEEKAALTTAIVVNAFSLFCNGILWLAGASNEYTCFGTESLTLDPYKMMSLVFAGVAISISITTRIILWKMTKRTREVKTTQILSNMGMVTFALFILLLIAIRHAFHQLLGYNLLITQVAVPPSVLIIYSIIIMNHEKLRVHSIRKMRDLKLATMEEMAIARIKLVAFKSYLNAYDKIKLRRPQQVRPSNDIEMARVRA